jgi:hypothetical protein
MQKCVIAIPCVVYGSHTSAFSYTTCTCIFQLVWFTSCSKFIDSLIQDVWVSSYKYTDQSWPPIFRTIRLQQREHSFRFSLSLSLFLQLQSWLCIGMFCRRTIFCVSYMQIHVQMFLIIVTFDAPRTSSRKQLWSSSGPKTPQFPHPFFLTSIKTVFITVSD